MHNVSTAANEHITSVSAPISIAEARCRVLAHTPLGRTERVPLLEAAGRVAAEDITSDIDVTPFDDSGMDGFAVVAADLENASEDSPVALPVVVHLGAGDYFDGELQPGQCARIMTGAAVPAGATAVVQIEKVTFPSGTKGAEGEAVLFSAPVKEGTNIRKAGEEAKAGEVVIPAGSVISSAGIGVLASTGNAEVTVYARPVVGVITIGSELTSMTEVPGPGKIRDSNRWAIATYVRDAGAIAQLYPCVADEEDAIRAAFSQAAAECDFVVSTGGACIGDYDLTPAILAELGEIFVERVSMKPGKSQPVGVIDGKPVFVLSGNPGASSVGFEMFVRPALLKWQGFTNVDRPCVRAVIDSDVKKKEPRVFLQRGILRREEGGTDPATGLATGGRWVVSQYKNQSSALFGSLQWANCLIIVPEGLAGFTAGDEVDCILTGVPETAM